MTNAPRVGLPVILGVFILSGAAGLVYEVVWARQLVLVFGNTTQAVSAILTGFFGGMAIGSALGGRLADRVRRPLRMYGLLELVLVVVVILTPITFRLLHEVYRGAFGTLEANPGLLALVRFGLALLALGPATILMGATLPTLTRYLSRHADHLSEAFGELYAANTLGAIVGTIVAGFVLIEILGLTGTLLVGAACSAVAGTIALVLDRRVVVAARANPASARVEEPDLEPPAPVAAGPVDASPAAPAASSARRPISAFRLGILVAFVSGLTSLAYQTLWTRLLAAGTGNYTYVFTMILALFLIGIALGAIAFTLIRPWIRNTVGLLAVAQLGTAVLVVLGAVLVIPGASTGILDMHGSAGGLFDAFLRTSALVVLPATFVMGLSFPAASALVAGSDREVGGRAGLLLASNTIGAIAGTFLIPFVVIPRIGSPDALALVAMVNAGLAIVLALWGGLGRPAVRAAIAASGTVVIGLLVVAVAGGQAFVDPTVARIERTGGTVVRSAEDEIASVQGGVDANGNKHLSVTGSSMTLLTVDAKLMPVLPSMARPEAKTAAVVAFGMGFGLSRCAHRRPPGRCRRAGPVRADDVRAVLRRRRGRPGRSRRSGDRRRRAEPHRADRSALRHHRDRPTAAGRERRRVGHLVGGVLPRRQGSPQPRRRDDAVASLSGQSIDEFLAHVRSFRAAFPQVLIAFGPGGYGVYMLGSDAPLSFDPANVAAVLARPGVTEDLSSAFDSPEHTAAGWARRIPSLVWISGDDVARVVGDGPLITDDHPLPEYFLLRHMFGAQSPYASPQLLLQLSASPSTFGAMDEYPGAAPTVGSLTLVLPAFNEAERLGPALDELFGYLHRRGARRRGAPASGNAARTGSGARRRRRELRRDGRPGPGPARGGPGAGPRRRAGRRLAVLTVPHGGKGAAVRAGMLAARSDLVVFADADMATPPDQLPLLIGALVDPRRRARQPDPARRLRHARASQPFHRRVLGKVFHALAVGLGDGAGPRHPVRLQGLPAHGGPGPVRSPAGHEHRVRRRAHLPRAAARLPDRRSCRSSGPTGAARGCAPGPASALRVAWDLFRIPLIHRRVARLR